MPRQQWWLKLRPLCRILGQHEALYTSEALLAPSAVSTTACDTNCTDTYLNNLDNSSPSPFSPPFIEDKDEKDDQ